MTAPRGTLFQDVLDRRFGSLLAMVAAVVYSTFAVMQHRQLRTTTYDLVIFDQAVRGYSHLGSPVSAAKGVHNGFGPHFSVLGDHFSPILALLAPLYRLYDDPVTLLVAQAVLLAVSIIPIWVFAARRFRASTAYVVATAYALSWGLQQMLAADFHELAFAVPLVALAIERWDAQRHGQALAVVLSLLLVKEDMGLLVAAFGVLFLLHRRWRSAVLLVVVGLGAVALSMLVLVPAAGGRADYYWSYDALGNDVPSVLSHVVTHPLDTLQLLVTPDTKWHTLLWLVGPLLLLPLFSPITLLAVPFLVERLLSANPNFWTTSHHYNSVLMPIVTLGAVDGLGRLTARLRPTLRPRIATGWSVAVLAGAVALCTVFPFQRLARSDEWRTSAADRAARSVIDVVPSGAVVEASNRLGPQLTRGHTVLLLDTTPRGAPWVVADVGRQEFPFVSVDDVRARVAWLRSQGYALVASEGGFVALHDEAG